MNKYDYARLSRDEKIAYYNSIDFRQATSAHVDNGAFGKSLELTLTRDKSLKTRVSKETNSDNYFSFNNGSKRIAKAVEVKTNGGRIGKIIKAVEKGKNGYVIYQLNVCNSTTKNKLRYTDPLIMTYEKFVNALIECGAIRTLVKDGVQEYAIQPSNKAWYEWLLDYPVIYDINEVYSDIDFE